MTIKIVIPLQFFIYSKEQEVHFHIKQNIKILKLTINKQLRLCKLTVQFVICTSL